MKTNKLEPIVGSKRKIHSFFDELGGMWPKEKRLNQVVEETGELADELLGGDIGKQYEELGDLCFTYIWYVEDFSIEDLGYKDEILSYIKESTKIIELKNNKDIVLALMGRLSRENKIFRKLEGRRERGKYTELDMLKEKYLNIFLLYRLTKNYGTTVSELVDNSINKFNERDLKK